MAWPTDPLDLAADLQLGGTWTAAKSYLYQRDGMQPPVPATRGRPDESAQVNPSAANFEVNNRDGRWSPKNPLGAWYGQLGRNTPLRLSVPAQANYLRLEGDASDRAFVNDTAALHITGSIEMRIQLDLSDWQGCILAAKWDNGGCWYWALNADATLTFGWFDSGVVFRSVTSSVPVPFARGTMALRVTMDATTGNVAFYTAASIDASYAQLGAVASGTGGAATSIQSVITSALVVGYSFALAASFPVQMRGRVAEYRLYNGIAGSVVADGVFSGQSPGTTTWTDSAGRTWLLSGLAEISGRDYRYHGQLSALPPRWDSTGTDQAVPVTAGGPLRRIGQGQSPVLSPMKRALLSRTGTVIPVAYWPWEDAAGATALGSAIGGPLMQFDGSPTLATDSSFLASAPLPQLNGARFYGQVPSYSGSGSIIIRFLMKLGTAPASTQPLVRITTTGTATDVTLSVTSAGFINLVAGATTVTSNLVSPTVGGSWSGQQWWMSIELRPSGGNVSASLAMLAPGATTGFTVAPATFAGSVGNVNMVRVNPAGLFADTVTGHFSAQADWENLFDFQQPLDAWTGEPAGQRFARLAGENGLLARVMGAAAVTALMGPQSIATLQTLLQECEDADRGQQYEPRQCGGIAYRTLASMLNQAPRVTLDYSAAVLGGVQGGGAGELQPAYDDQRARNDESVTRGSSGGSGSQGATFRYVLDDGSPMSVGVIGEYDNSDTVNVEADSQVPHLASWIVHVGTVDEARWPVIPVNLRRGAIQSGGLYYPLLSLDAGDYLEVLNLPGVITADPVKQVVLGVKESMGGFHHTLEFNCAPESPYEVAVYNDATYGRADTSGTTLNSSVSSGGTAFSLATTSGFLPWTVAPADYPFDLAVGGERVCALCAGTPVNTNAQLAGLTGWSPSNGTAVLDSTHQYVTSLPAALVTPNGSSASGGLNASTPTAPASVTAGAVYIASCLCYSPQGWTDVRACIDWYTSGGVFISTGLGAASVVAAGQWAVLTQQLTAPATSSECVARFRWGSTPASSVQFWIQDLPVVPVTTVSASSPQLVTVVRSVNGVVKAHNSGEDVRLWTPPVYSLI